MVSVRGLSGTITFPPVNNDPIIRAIEDGCHPNTIIEVGSLPNRFEAEVPGAEAMEMGRKASEDLLLAWKEVAGKIRDFLQEHLSQGVKDAFDAIWNRQVENMWDVQWVVGEKPRLLDIRKTIRNFAQIEEPGEKCTQCGERQALCDRAGASRADLRQFWRHLAAKINTSHPLTFGRAGAERLCAVCTIKRLIPVAQPYAWQVPAHYPSVSTMATLPWKEAALAKLKLGQMTGQDLRDYVSVMVNAELGPADARDAFAHWPELVDSLPAQWRQGVETFLRLDGEWLISESFEKRDFPGDPDKAEVAREKAIEFVRKARDSALNNPSPFFSILIMDGDRMGKLLGDFRQQRPDISQALAEFSIQRVPAIIKNHKGKLIYAGGDDVLALVPLPAALACSAAIQQAYRDAFRNHTPPEVQDRATISAGIVYAHHKIPLSVLLNDAHRLLDSVAKDELDRSAFAVRVWKQGGPLFTFGKKWLEEQQVGEFKGAFEQGRYSSRFLHWFSDMVGLIHQESKLTWTEEDLRRLLIAQLLKTRERKLEKEETERLADNFMEICRWKGKGGDEFRAGGPLFVRFLSQQEVVIADRN
jgi:CRISPR-associated protein Cmr2